MQGTHFTLASHSIPESRGNIGRWAVRSDLFIALRLWGSVLSVLTPAAAAFEIWSAPWSCGDCPPLDIPEFVGYSRQNLYLV